MPTIANSSGINIVPSLVCKMHGFKLVDIVNFGWGDA